VACSDKPDLITMDIQLPEVSGLDYGADDYLIKPVGSRELVARVQAMLRRAELPAPQDTERASYSDNFLTVDVAERKVLAAGGRVKLTPLELKLLAFMLKNAGRILTHKQLLEEVWGWEYADDVDYVRIYIWHLRRKIEPDPSQPQYIVTEPGVGYYFQNEYKMGRG
jgi:two-component system KDP operon response regulator KdpE